MASALMLGMNPCLANSVSLPASRKRAPSRLLSLPTDDGVGGGEGPGGGGGGEPEGWRRAEAPRDPSQQSKWSSRDDGTQDLLARRAHVTACNGVQRRATGMQPACTGM